MWQISPDGSAFCGNRKIFIRRKAVIYSKPAAMKVLSVCKNRTQAKEFIVRTVDSLNGAKLKLLCK